MKIKQIEKGSNEPINEILHKLNKLDSNSESSDAFEIVLALFTNTLFKLDNKTTQSNPSNPKHEFIGNSQVNHLFQQLLKNIDSKVPTEVGSNIQTNTLLNDIVNPKALLEQLIEYKNLSLQNNNLNNKIASILINSLPDRVIQFLKNNKIEVTPNTQDELLQIARLFEKINTNQNNHPNEPINSIVIENSELASHKVENIEDNLPKVMNTEKVANTNKSTEQQKIGKTSDNIATKDINIDKSELPAQNSQPKTLQDEQTSKVNTPTELKHAQLKAKPINSIVIENSELASHKVENIEDNLPKVMNTEKVANTNKSTEQQKIGKTSDNIATKDINIDKSELPAQNSQPKTLQDEQTSKVNVLTPNEIIQEQNSLKKSKINNANLDNILIDTKDENSTDEVENLFKKGNSEKSYSDKFHEKSNVSQGSSIIENKILSQEIKTKNNVEFLNSKMVNFTPKTSNYTIFNSIHPNEIPRYIVRMSNSIKDGGNYRAIMNLKPENLGSIFVNLAMKDDVLNIIIKVDMQQTLEKIDSSIAQLKEALVNNGFKYDNINLRVESNQTNVQNYASNNKGFDSPNRQKHDQELREMIQRIQQYEHILNSIKQQEVVE